jgi:hypothetical protein
MPDYVSGLSHTSRAGQAQTIQFSAEPFREKKIPSITIHSLLQETVPILHSSKDRIEAIHKDQYYRTYSLVLAYLACSIKASTE